MHLDGVKIVGMLPDPIKIETVFAGGVCTAASDAAAARSLLDFLAAPETADVKRRNGMDII